MEVQETFMTGCNQTMKSFGKGTVVAGGHQSCRAMQRGTTLTVRLTNTKARFW